MYTFIENGRALKVDAQVEQTLVKGGKKWRQLIYRVLDDNSSTIRMAIDGEERKTADGVPVVWDLVMLSNARICWRRADWPSHACTKDLVRCE